MEVGGICVISVVPRVILWEPGKDKLRQSEAHTDVNTNLSVFLFFRNLVTILDGVIMPSRTRLCERYWPTATMRKCNMCTHKRSKF